MYRYAHDVSTLYAYRFGDQIRVLYSSRGMAPVPPGGESTIISQVGVRVRDTIQVSFTLRNFYNNIDSNYWIIENEEDVNVTLQRIGAMINV